MRRRCIPIPGRCSRSTGAGSHRRNSAAARTTARRSPKSVLSAKRLPSASALSHGANPLCVSRAYDARGPAGALRRLPFRRVEIRSAHLHRSILCVTGLHVAACRSQGPLPQARSRALAYGRALRKADVGEPAGACDPAHPTRADQLRPKMPRGTARLSGEFCMQITPNVTS